MANKIGFKFKSARTVLITSGILITFPWKIGIACCIVSVACMINFYFRRNSDVGSIWITDLFFLLVKEVVRCGVVDTRIITIKKLRHLFRQAVFVRAALTILWAHKQIHKRNRSKRVFKLTLSHTFPFFNFSISRCTFEWLCLFGGSSSGAHASPNGKMNLHVNNNFT